jgi:hypothetical protein
MVLALVERERERGRLALTKLGVFSKPMGSDPMRYDA